MTEFVFQHGEISQPNFGLSEYQNSTGGYLSDLGKRRFAPPSYDSVRADIFLIVIFGHIF